ncbi:unnamed protein product [Rotaria sordida]|uniref:Uncharacterized protein n=1 Tax=Rotaria sordida TaxID=392033 RepID=A0A814P5W0_9BILA|nr:unnamed protein product [Rotaria sordida]CAF1303996.1 unnamed protein product [Rotaria sordida]
MIVGGVLGPIKAYFGTVVSQGRVPRSWNTPPRLSRDNIYVVLSTIDLTGLQQNIYGPNNIISTPLKEQFVSSILHVSALSNKLLQTPTRNQSTSVINASYNESKVIPACLPTPNPSSSNFASRFRADVVQLVEDRDDHLLQVISEAQVDNDTINPVLLLAKHDVHGEYDMDDSDDLLELLGNLDEYTTAAVNTTRKTTENKYIEEIIEAVENVGRFNHTNTYYQSSLDISIDRTNRQLIPFLCATPHLVQLNAKWQKQLKIEKERVRRSLIIGNYDKDDDTLDLFAIRDAVVTVVNPNNYSTNNFENYGSILPVLKVIHNFPTQASIINEFTLNREQRAAFMIITSHLDGDNRCRISIFTIHVITNRNIQSV